MPRAVRLLVTIAVFCAILLAAPRVASASTWTVLAKPGSSAEAHALTVPATPAGVAATCTSATQTTIKVTWSAVIHATKYTVYQSTTSSSSGYSAVATGVAGTSWTSGALASGSYWFEVAAFVGNIWVSANSSATAKRTIGSSSCA